MERAGAKKGFTLVEIFIVVAILALVATVAARRFASVRNDARRAVALHDMRVICDAFAGTAEAPGFVGDMECIPGFSPAWLRVANLLTPTNLYGYAERRETGAAFLAWDAEANRGWRGPYVRIDRAGGGLPFFPQPSDRRSADSPTFAECGFYPPLAELSVPSDYRPAGAGLGFAYGFPGEPALYDPWGSPYVLQIPPPQAFAHSGGVLATNVPGEERFRYARIVSSGPDGILTTPCFFANTNETGSFWTSAQRRDSIFAGAADSRGDDIVLFLYRSDVFNPAYEKEGDPR